MSICPVCCLPIDTKWFDFDEGEKICSACGRVLSSIWSREGVIIEIWQGENETIESLFRPVEFYFSQEGNNYPDLEIISLDFSKQMVTKAKEKLGQ